MIPREILQEIRQIEIQTQRLVTESTAGQYHSAFKGQGMDFDEVREYQPGDDVRSIDWNVTARMNHPFIKKFVEERELTVILVVDLSRSMLFGSRREQPSTKRKLAARVASMLAFSAIRNNDKVGLLLYTDRIETFIPPRKGRRHVLRVIREILFFEPQGRGTDLQSALGFVQRVQTRKAIVVLVSDYLGQTRADPGTILAHLRRGAVFNGTLGQTSLSALRQARRRHDVVAVHIEDPFEVRLPSLGRIFLEDLETGEIAEVDTRNARRLEAFAERSQRTQLELQKLFRSARIDLIRLQTGTPYATALAKFFETREKRRLRG